MKTRLSHDEQRRRELAQIHIAKTQLGLDDGTYRDMLWNIAKVRSSRDLTTTGRLRILQHLRDKGWKKKLRGKSPTNASNKEALIGKIAALLTEMQLPWAYANGISQQMFKIERVDWCSASQLHKIVAALTYQARKHHA